MWLGVREQLWPIKEFKAEEDVNRLRFWQDHSGCSVGCGLSGDQNECRQTSQQAISEEIAQKGRDGENE